MDLDDVYDEVKAFRKENKSDHAAIYKTVNAHGERLATVEANVYQLDVVQKSCLDGQKKKALQTRGAILSVVVKIAGVIIIAGLACIAGAAIAGCSTPETLKESLSLTDQAVDLCIESMPDNSAIAKPLRDVKAGLAPVKLYIGAPKTLVKYDAQSDMAVMKAELAASEVRQQQMMKNFFQNFARDVLPSQLKSLVPAPEGPLSGGNLEMLIVIILGYLTSKGGLKIGGKILARKNGTGNDGNKL